MAKPKQLPLEIIREIRRDYATDDYTQKELAQRYQVSQSTISKIVNNYIHKPPQTDIQLGGEAEVMVGYNYGN